MVKEEKYDEGEKQKNGANPCGRTHTHTHNTLLQNKERRYAYYLSLSHLEPLKRRLQFNLYCWRGVNYE